MQLGIIKASAILAIYMYTHIHMNLYKVQFRHHDLQYINLPCVNIAIDLQYININIELLHYPALFSK